MFRFIGKRKLFTFRFHLKSKYFVAKYFEGTPKTIEYCKFCVCTMYIHLNALLVLLIILGSIKI